MKKQDKLNKKVIHIHFVCSGNTFRSRLAEAYLKSKQIPNLHVSSSGVEAHKNESGPICWYTARLVAKHNLSNHVKHTWTKTESKFLSVATLVVFMTEKHYNLAKNKLNYSGKHFEVWDIPDLDDQGFTKSYYTPEDDLGHITASEKVYELLKEKVDALLASRRLL